MFRHLPPILLKRRKEATSVKAHQKTSKVPSESDIEKIIAHAQKTKAETTERLRQEREEASLRQRVKVHLISAWNYTSPTGRTTDPSNWVDTIYWILKTSAYHARADILIKIPERGEARKVLLHACRLIQDEKYEQARKMLGNAFDSDLGPALWKDLSRQFPRDVSRLLPKEIRLQFVRECWTTRPVRVQSTKTAVPISESKRVHRSVFARLPDGRYRIEYAGRQDTVPGYKGLDLIRYLLRQPNKRHGLLAINRDLYADEVPPGKMEWNDEDGDRPGLPQGNTVAERPQAESLDAASMRKIEEEIARLNEQIQTLRANGDGEQQIPEIEKQIQTAIDYLNKHRSKLSPELEKVRKRLHKNLKNAYRHIEAAGLIELAKHLKEHINYDNGAYLYHSPTSDWSFEPLLPPT
jgi:hypothetical protein